MNSKKLVQHSWSTLLFFDSLTNDNSSYGFLENYGQSWNPQQKAEEGITDVLDHLCRSHFQVIHTLCLLEHIGQLSLEEWMLSHGITAEENDVPVFVWVG